MLYFSAGMRCTPLIIEVHKRKAIEADLDDNGFQPRIIRIDEGNAVHWRWKDCSLPHQVWILNNLHTIYQQFYPKKKHSWKSVKTEESRTS